MKIFISWSGTRSKYVAEALYEWLPKVLQAVQPWISSEDISSGTRWADSIAKELEDVKVGIICLTSENQHAPWIMFEAGALSKTLTQTFVCPYLIDLKPSQVSGPLSLFQNNEANRDGTLKLLQTLNAALIHYQANPINGLEEIFDVWWSKLQKKLANLPPLSEPQQKTRSIEDILEELLGNSREHIRREDIRIASYAEKETHMDNFITMLEEFTNLLNVTNPIKHINSKKPDVPGIMKDIDSMGKFAMPEMFSNIQNLINASKKETQDLLNTPNETVNETEPNSEVTEIAED